MHTILAVIVAAAAPMAYVAQVPTFGCNSTAEVVELQRIRSDKDAFQKLLYQQVFYGQCIAIAQGTVVEGATEANNTTVLRVGGQLNPPGHMAPLSDFKLKPADGKP